MASNKHFGVDILNSAFQWDADFDFLQWLGHTDPNDASAQDIEGRMPYKVKKGSKFFFTDRRICYWPAEFVNFDFQASGYDNPSARGLLYLKFDSALQINEINAAAYLYSFFRAFEKNWESRARKGKNPKFSLAFECYKLSDGSISKHIGIVLIGIGQFFALYPDIKDGINEMASDGYFLMEVIERALRASVNDGDQRDDQSVFPNVVYWRDEEEKLQD